ncbi:GAF domain-containing protein [Thermocatellispora tengchongensis]|uniref:protein-serine/threonine phosphatase n=1 Tax=Thermocatellispora tengchongensis TaxID=1073253 RepID=A0A840P176_9ACTN|nr:SpoIIE family protein phosphatase [Thermocatellispora tengchongensis]MBB5133448.1 GAF domain-containing protein [Thermocatellispora tengchongensis]
MSGGHGGDGRGGTVLVAVLEGPDHVVTCANEPCVEWFGARAFRYGTPVRELLPGRQDERFLEPLDEVFRRGEPRALPGLPVKVQPVAGGGVRERVFDVRYDPSRDADGRVRGVIVTATDVTWDLYAEQLAEGRHRLLEQIAVQAPLPLVLDGMARLVEDLLPGTRTMVMLFDAEGRRLRPVAGPSLPDFLHRAVAEVPAGPHGGTCGTTASTRTLTVTPDITTDPSWEGWREMAVRAGIRSCWSVPIMAEGELLGTFAFYRQDTRRPADIEVDVVSMVGQVAALAIERHRVLAGEQAARRRELEAQADLKFVLDASLAVTGSLSYLGALQRLADLAVPRVAPMCAIDVLDDGGANLMRVAVRHAGERRLACAAPDLAGDEPVARVMRSGTAMVVQGDEGYVVMPLTARGRTFGVVSLRGTPEQPITERVVSLAGELARAAALAVDNARRHADSLRQVAALRRLSDRLSLLAQVSGVLTATLDMREALKRLARLVVPQLGDWAVVNLRTGEDTVERIAVVHRDGPERVPPGAEGTMPPIPPAGPDPLVRALRQGVTTLMGPAEIASPPGSDLQRRQHELFEAMGARSVIVTPLRSRRRVVGTLTVARADPVAGSYGADDVEVVQDIARRAALVVESARLYCTQRDVAEGMQRHLLTPLPALEGVELAARYVPAPEGSQVGGDWYDAMVLADGVPMVAVGDVIGHDVHAAAQMANLRSALRTLAWDGGGPPSAIMARLDSVLTHVSDIDLATLVLARIERRDEGRRLLRWTSAGHPPPLLVTADGRARFLNGGQGVLLGLDHGPASRPDAEETLPDLCTLLLYTDGLVESRATPLGEGMTRLRRHASALARLPVDPLCDRLLARLPPRHGDDVALLAVRVRAGEG